MGFNVKLYINEAFATTAENLALRNLVNRLQAVSLPPNDPHSGDGSPLWIFVEPHLFTHVGKSGTRRSKPDLLIVKRNAMLVVEMKHWWGEIALPQLPAERDDVWDGRAPGGFVFERRKPNPLSQVEFNRETLKIWLRERSAGLPSSPAKTSNWDKISRTILFTHPELRIIGGVPSYFQPTSVSSLHRVPNTIDIVEQIASAATGVRDPKTNPIPQIYLDDVDAEFLASELGLVKWDPLAGALHKFVGPKGIISHWWPGAQPPNETEAQADPAIEHLPVQIRLIEFYRRKLAAEAKANPDINLTSDRKAWAKHLVIPEHQETLMSLGETVLIGREIIPKALAGESELAYGLFWNVRTDPDTSFHSASPLFYIGCSLDLRSENQARIIPENPSAIELNADLLKTFRPFSLMDDEEFSAFLTAYEKHTGFKRVQFVLQQIDYMPETVVDHGMELVSEFPANADLLHAAVLFIPDKMMTRRLLDDLTSVQMSWQNTLAAGSTPNDLAWKLLSHHSELGFATTPDYRARISSPLNYEQTQVLQLVRDPGVNVVAVQGPPGTGKTRALASLAADCIAVPRTMLITSTNNTAVSNVVSQLATFVGYPAIFKIGSVKTIDDFRMTLAEFQGAQCAANAIPQADRADVASWAKQLELLDGEIHESGLQLDEYYRCREQLAQANQALSRILLQFPVLQSLDVSDYDRALKQAEKARVIAEDYRQLKKAANSFFKRLQESFKGRVGAVRVFTRKSFLIGAGHWFDLCIADSLSPGWEALLRAPFEPPNGDDVRVTADEYILWCELRDVLTMFVGSFDENISRQEFEKLQERRSFLCTSLLRSGHRKRRCEHAVLYDTELVDTSIQPHRTAVEKFSPLACTLHSVSKYYPPNPGIVDVVAIDESSQCSIGVALPALFRARKLVVVGDLKQLQPVSSLVESKLIDIAIECSVDSDDLALWVNPQSSLQSLVEYQITRTGSDTVVRLTDHHRSVPEIIEFSNTTFYQGTLRPRRTSNSNGKQLKWIDIRGTEVDKVNSDEIDAVIAQIKVLLEHGILPSDIGVVTPFAYQKHELTEHFVREMGTGYLGDKDSPGVMIDTAHGFQGNERHTMIISTVITSKSKPGRVRWVTTGSTAASLINVSVTRATDMLIVVGDSSAALGYLGDLKRWINQHTS